MKIRTVALTGAALLLVVIGLSVILMSSLDGIAEAGIEKIGSEIMGAPVRVGFVKIDALDGKGSIHGLRVANPAGYPPGDAVSFGEITLGIDVMSLESANPIVINVVKVTAPSVSWTVNSKGKSNISVLEKNATDYAGSEAEPSQEPEPSSDEPQTLISIRKVSITGGSLAADLSAVRGPKIESTIAPIVLSNVGGTEGSTPEKIGATIATAFAKSVLKAVANSPIFTRLNQLLGEGLEKLNPNGVKDLVKGLFGR
ncbi:MAG: hypothetical protein GY910_03195 [bacterium]|nr:hypothetical protein [Deltaproteobacteria bacterium]MCP4903962.1 hypothetical protein [bacterium]